MRHIYLDYNATTPIAPSVREAMQPFFSEHFGNPSSDHPLGRACQFALEDARQKAAALIGAEPEEIVFTSGGSESNNLALKGVLARNAPRGNGHLVISAIEHPAISAPAQYLERLGYRVTVCPCDEHGVVSPAAVEAVLRTDTVLVSVMHANNETGAIQPISGISAICRKRGILVHTDAAQSIGKIPVDVDRLGVDLLTVVGHKIYAPKGVGALYLRQGIDIEPLVHGAGHELGLRAGTENVPYIVALGKAAELAARGTRDTFERVAGLRNRLYETLQAGMDGSLTVNSEAAERLPNTLSISFPRVTGAELLSRASEICASTGAACHSGQVSASPTLAAMNVPPDVARGTVRLSVGWPTSTDEIDRAASQLLAAWESLTAS